MPVADPGPSAGELRFMLPNPVIAMLRNTQTGQFHPIMYIESPLPGPPSPEKPVRHKSKGHRKEGFGTRTEALASIQTELVEVFAKAGAPAPKLCLEQDIEWDPQARGDIPASVAFFLPNDDGTMRRAL